MRIHPRMISAGLVTLKPSRFGHSEALQASLNRGPESGNMVI